MGSTVHIDRATSPLLDPPSSRIGKCSSLITGSKRLSGPTVSGTGLQPQNPGFTYNKRMGEDWVRRGDRRGLNRQICEELVKGPQTVTQDNKPPRKHCKHSINTVFNTRSKRTYLKESSKMPVATHRTSDGRKYRQILSEQIYDSSGNASTYQVNNRRRSPTPPSSDIQQKHATTSFDLVRHVSSAIHHINGTKQPMSERSASSSLGNEKAKHRLSPNQPAGNPCPRPEIFGNKSLTDGPTEGYAVTGRNQETPASLLKESTTNDSLGLLRDLSQILSRGETANLCAGASHVPVAEAEHLPRVRDFAADDSIPFSHARPSVQRKSRSHAKITGKQDETAVTPDRSFGADTCRGQLANRLGRSPNGIILPPMVPRDRTRPPLESPLPTTQEQISGTKTSPAINHHSKAPSIVSAESTAENIQSDASSGVIFNAQSAVFVRVPPQPGPAPRTPLPSLPERLDNFAPLRPKAIQSSQNAASPEGSPTKVPPQKSPARCHYRLYPSVDTTTPKRPSSPIRMNSATEGVTQLSPPLHLKQRDCSFTRSDYLQTSMSDSKLDEPEQWNKMRVDKTGQTKMRDLDRMRPQRTMIAEVEPVAQDTVNGKIYNDGAAGLPRPVVSCRSETLPVKHRPQASQASNLSASTTLQHRDSSTLAQQLSPIIVIAEQEPTSQGRRGPSQYSHFNKDKTDEQTQDSKINRFNHVLPHPLSPTLQRPNGKSKARPVSFHSLPVPHLFASQATTGHLTPPLREPSCHLFRHSPTHEISVLEARLSAIERKNSMLERAFLAVINTSAAFGGGLGLKGMLDTCEDTSSDLSGRYGSRFGGTSGPESLYVGLDNLMPLHSGSAGARLSTSSGP